jgi:hypothetical protein
MDVFHIHFSANLYNLPNRKLYAILTIISYLGLTLPKSVNYARITASF